MSCCKHLCGCKLSSSLQQHRSLRDDKNLSTDYTDLHGFYELSFCFTIIFLDIIIEC